MSEKGLHASYSLPKWVRIAQKGTAQRVPLQLGVQMKWMAV